MYTNQKAIDLIDAYYFVPPNQNQAEAFERAKANALSDIQSMKVEDFKLAKAK